MMRYAIYWSPGDMAEQLVQFYQRMEQAAGLQGKTKLAIETKIPATRAALAPDSAENIALFRAAYEKIVGTEKPT